MTELINSFETQLKELFRKHRHFKIMFFVHKEGDQYNLQQYDCWNIITHIGLKYASEHINEVAEKALEDIKKIYKDKELMAC